MVMTYRDEKGSPLTSAEVDENFRHVNARIDDVVDNPPTAVSVSNITETDTTFTVWMSDGSFFGPFTKPVATMRWRGNWAASTGYFQNDLVYNSPSLYIVTQNHVSDTTFDDALENSGENIYVQILGPLEFTTLANLEDVSYDEGSPAHGDILRYDAEDEVWRPEHEVRILNVTTNTLTLGAAHLGRYLRFTHVDGCVVTIPNQASTDWDEGTLAGTSALPAQSGRRITMVQKGGPITVEAAAFVDLNIPAGYLNNTNGLNHVIELIHTSDPGVSDNDWDLYGLLERDASAGS